MRFYSYRSKEGSDGLAIASGSGVLGISSSDDKFPGDLLSLIKSGSTALTDAAKQIEAMGQPIDLTEVEVLPPIGRPEKIICIGANYADHVAESGFSETDYPTVFARYWESLIGHDVPLIVPAVSDQLDYEGELVAIIGRGGRHIKREDALAHVAGYSIFNDGSIRDYQLRTTQWTVGKTFDGTGAFGPVFVTADELPDGCKGCHLKTRVNGVEVQSAPIDNMIFDVATLVSAMSEAMTLVPGDIIVTGTPDGVGFARKPQLFLKAGDICEVEIDQIGILRNTVVNESDQHR